MASVGRRLEGARAATRDGAGPLVVRPRAARGMAGAVAAALWLAGPASAAEGLVAAPSPAPSPAPAATAATTCAKADFEGVVDNAAGVLRDLNQKNKPAFQDKLRQLKDKRGWNHETFLKEAEPFVRDGQTNAYDQQSEDLLAKISSMGQEGADAKTPDCKVLADLKGFMASLVDVQTKKWSYMTDKLDKELAK